MTKLFFSLLFSLIFCILDASGDAHAANPLQEGKRSLRVEIDYGGLRPSRVVETIYSEGMTALNVLKQVAEVQTHQVGGFVFVRAIDKIRSERGKMGWFYSIDGVSAKRIADSYRLKDERTMRWSYRVEACY